MLWIPKLGKQAVNYGEGHFQVPTFIPGELAKPPLRTYSPGFQRKNLLPTFYFCYEAPTQGS